MKKIIISIIACLLVMLVVFKKSNNTISIHKDYYTPTSIEDAYSKASYIVQGNFGEYLNDWNMARDENDVSKESSTDVYIGKIYSFKVNKILKGNIDDEIKITIPYTERIYLNNGELVDGSEAINKTSTEYLDYQSAEYFKPDNNKEYLLYLDYDKDFDHYYASFVPIGVVIDNDNISYINESKDNIVNTYSTNKNNKYNISQENLTYCDFMKDTTYNELMNKIDEMK